MVPIGGFDHKFHVFINLFLLNFAAYRFNHIAPGKNFIQHPFTENFIPAARASGGDTTNYNRFFIHR